MSIRVSTVHLCRHTKTDGRRCRSAALGPSAFCYHHRSLHGIRPVKSKTSLPLGSEPLGPLHDRQSIMAALDRVLNGVWTARLGSRTAGQMICLLRMALSGLNHP